jgi:flagellar protein FliS
MTMLARHNPQDAYRRVDFDARVTGCDPMELVSLCYEHLIGALGSALFAHERGDITTKSKALTRAISAVTALQLGVNGTEGVAAALHQFYQASRSAMLDSVLNFNPEQIARVRGDFVDIASAMTAGAQPN